MRHTEQGQWYYKGCIIQEQHHPKLLPYVIFEATGEEKTIGTASTKGEAKKLIDNYLKKDEKT